MRPDADPPQKFKLLKFKKPSRDRVAEHKERLKGGVAVEPETAVAAVEASLPEAAKAQWLDLVVHLLGACRRASVKMKKRIGMATYREAALSKGRSKLKTSGSIIDTTGEILADSDVKKVA
ncbi:MAG: hypothetical protein HY075_09770 [Deltaproteobacteria bacterium]|nr:hypothetical protein [Deltaproteobacteria bacterium]